MASLQVQIIKFEIDVSIVAWDEKGDINLNVERLIHKLCINLSTTTPDKDNMLNIVYDSQNINS
ncbi:hypothetical protein MADE_1014750 [Alteromonas mediterranea DE]|uniref:Uncharacterized protein n=1 Tax=Alteromonas mediterranea (strain DSM 17117 / CIP 110805 / LMG 28347 / Deep ecotype) TaxID=1774373 RepID=F2GCC8_ALTMD|nr:hypothetical protein MADE_1014750 [Alteromonas mediterranea DE]